ncbi:glycoside hydrolase family 43 protein [Pseudarthrobacter scleromae]|uniref:Glycosyl hydrolase family 43 n=1 Tax=Pseudarthrobacter scleromae TaxID=158897 RepID=A0ABQ2CFP8_9MICC|nr:glycoside hydrolase family 43 protein [Pseudarthrobacter scleromae]GGI78749.1 glycosyl hydrolase family 43 [Pseudarthrobacter scleromae]
MGRSNQPAAVQQLRLGEIRMRDPFILETVPGEFVLFGTSDQNVWGGPATGFDCYTSNDLDHWDGPIPAFRPPPGFWADTQYWAPEVHALEGRFFMFATFADSTRARSRGVAVLVSDQPAGPYQPWSDGPVTPANEPCLDGTLHIDDDSTRWLVYSRGTEGTSDSPGIADGEMYALRLSEDLRTGVGEPILLFAASSAGWTRPLRFPQGVEPPKDLHLAKDPLFTDGPFLLRSNEETLLMLWSSHGEAGYAMGIAESESGTVAGPWIQHDSPLWSSNGGHGMVLRASTGRDYLAFHWPNNTPDERVQLTEVHISGASVRIL